MFLAIVILAALMSYLTIVIGGDLTASEAGMACGESWPFCPGGVIPDLSQPGVIIEFTHRVVAFVTSLVILIALILAFLWYRRESPIPFLALTATLLLVAQVILGMATVQSKLDPAVVTAHLAMGTATFAVTLVLAVVAWRASPSRPSGEAAAA